MLIFKILKKWLPLAIVTAGLCGLVYLTMQQSLRMGANDPQIQMAEEAAARLNAGMNIEAAVGLPRVEIADSLAPILMEFDDQGTLAASSANLHGAMPAYPKGALEAARSGENRVTWQPEPGVRMASVVVHWKDGFIVAARSLREVEKRENQALQISLLAMLAILAATLVGVVLGELVGRSPGFSPK